MSLTVAINVPVVPGSGGGGVEQHFLGVIHSLAISAEEDDDLEFVLVVDDKNPTWLDPYIGENMRVVTPTGSGVVGNVNARMTDAVKRIARPVVKRTNVHNHFRSEPTVPDADRKFSKLGADVVHLPSPPFYRTDLPTIFCPHDLQHRHYSEFFPERAIKEREVTYSTGCREADVVVAPSEFVKSDIIDAYGPECEPIHVISRGPPTDLYDSIDDETVREAKAEYDLPDRFAFYPAQTMQHKNHRRLVEAVGRLRDEGIRIDLILTGKKSANWPEIKTRITEVGVDDRIRMLGYVPGNHLRALYRLAEFVVFPSLFEGGGFPLIESWAESTPVACSATTALGERAGDAAQTFDPESVDEIAEALRRMYTDADLRSQLVKRGNERIKEFSWEQTGRAYRHLYREVANGVLPKDSDGVLESVN